MVGQALVKMLDEAPTNTDFVGCLHAVCLKIVRSTLEAQRMGEAAEVPQLPPLVVATSALRSLNYHSGIVLLEELLLAARGDMSSATALARLKGKGKGARRAGAAEAGGDDDDRTGGYDGANADAWLQLSRLYGALGEKDVLVGLSARAARDPGTNVALDLEIGGNYSDAIKEYNRLIQAHMDDDEAAAETSDLVTWQQRSMECLRQLGEWGQVHGAITQCIVPDGAVEGLWEGSLREWALPQYVRACVHLPQYHGELRQVVENAARVGDRRTWLEENMAAELALNAALTEDWPKIAHFTGLGF
jgi:hypothetical protein